MLAWMTPPWKKPSIPGKDVKALESQRSIFLRIFAEARFLAFIKKLETVERRVTHLGG